MCFTLHSHQTMDTSCHSDKCMALCWKQQRGWEDTKRHNDVPALVALLGKANQYDICSARSPPQRTIWWVTLKNRVRVQNVCGSASIPAFREQRATAGMTMTKSPFCNGWRSTSLHGKFEVVCQNQICTLWELRSFPASFYGSFILADACFAFEADAW